MISGTKGDGEVRVLNSREWHEVVYARGIPSASSLFYPLRFLFIAKGALGRPARKESKEVRPGGSGRREGDAHNGRSSGRLKCSSGTALRSCVGQRLALKLKLLAKTYGEQSARRWTGGEEWEVGCERVGGVGL